MLAWPCELVAPSPADYLQRIGCQADYAALASVPLTATMPGAHSLKVVLDQTGGDVLYFQDSHKYAIHWDFASAHLSRGAGLPGVPQLAQFNQTEYYSLGRRFLLGAVIYYEGPQVWALEIAPYDTATAPMIEKLYEAVKAAAYFGPALAFHPTSQAVENTAKSLPSGVRIKSTDDLRAKIDYQPLSLGTAKGTLRFVSAAQLATTYVDFRDIVVLDQVPTDSLPVMGLITEGLQVPLSHINRLSQNRGTPNMGLRKAMTSPVLRALEGKWVRLDVGALTWSVQEIAAAEADAWWDAINPKTARGAGYDVGVTGLEDIETVVTETETASLKEVIQAAVPSFGGEAVRFSILSTATSAPNAFAVPITYYDQFMRENGFFDRVGAMLADPRFTADPAARDQQLTSLRADMLTAPVDQSFQDLLRAKLATRLPGIATVRFASSSNGEDLDDFSSAAPTLSQTGDPNNWPTVLEAVRTVWSSVWRFSAFEERRYRGIDQTSIGMALLVLPDLGAALANGVALTANPFDAHGVEPGFYLNVEKGDHSVVFPAAGLTSDQFLYFFDYPNQPTVFLTHSGLVAKGESVLTRRQTYDLGVGLAAIHKRFTAAYRPANGGWYAMEVEFKLYRDSDGAPMIMFEHVRPHPGRGTDPLAE